MSMFGNNVQSSWANPPQQQQQQAQPSAFGQPSTFGATTGAFGGGGAFGQSQQQQQTNPMFGGAAATPAPASGFGAFGAPAAQASSGSMFGAPKPNTGFGAFGGGGTGAFGGGGTSAFGAPAAAQPAASGGLFGQTSSTNAFGSSPSVFGAPKPTFGGATSSVPVAPPVGGYPTVAPITTGTSAHPYQPFGELDGSSKIYYQSITSQEPYRGCSFEELRVQDYAAGRKTAGAGAPGTGAFGQPATNAFGAPQAAPTTSLFGQTQQPQQQTSLFAGGTGPFGQPAAAPAATSAFGSFGQPAAAAPATGGSMFGGGGGAFGQPAQQPAQTSAFGAFGQPQQAAAPAASGGLFGGSTGAFGAPKPATSGAFGFGGTTAAAPATSAFGQPAAPATNAFGAFGAPKPSIFGAPAAAPATSNIFGGGGSAFGQPQQQQPAAQPTGGLFGGGGAFGQPQQQQQQPSTGLFGQTNQPAQQQTGSLFGGGGTTGGGLFGGQTAQQPAQQNAFGGGGLFGAPKPAAPTGSLFGQPAATGGGIFGGASQNNNNQQQQQQQPASGGIFGGGSMFGAKPAASQQNQGSSIFGNSFGGSTTNNNNNGASTNNNGQGTLTASISQPIGVNLPIFSMLPPGPRAVDLEQSTKKKASFFVDVPTRSPAPRLQLGYTPANSKLRGFASSSALNGSHNGNPFAASLSFSSGKPNALSLSRNDLQTDAFLGRSSSPSLGSGGRQSVKKLILDKKIEPSELFSRSGSSPARAGSPKVTFNPALGVAAREREAAAAAAAALAASTGRSTTTDSPTPKTRAQSQRTPNRFTAEATKEPETAPGSPEKGQLKEGDYWVSPPIEELRRAPHGKLSAFPNLVVGRIGYGEITFLEPVDLTGLPKLTSLFGDIVRFDDKECTVYPDSDESDKPPPGSGLNVAAKISIDRCWALDKATREPIKDAAHPVAVRHLKRLTNMRDTKFEGFEYEEGRWTFSVDHF